MVSKLLDIMVCYGRAQTQGEPWCTTLQVEEGTTLEQAVERSGLLTQCPEVNWADYQTGKRTGIFSKLRPIDTLVQQGDRVEVYAPLQADPKAARHKRVARTRVDGSKEGVRWVRGRIAKLEAAELANKSDKK